MTTIMRGNMGKVRNIGPARVVNNSVDCVHSVTTKVDKVVVAESRMLFFVEFTKYNVSLR